MGIDLYSNADTKALIKSLITKGREPHSIAVCGDDGSGKKTMAGYIAASLLCEENDGEPCGKCKSCKMISKGVHPDFIVVNSNDNGNYQVDVIREMVADAVIKPNEGKFKVYLIPDLDRSMNTNVQVQNILLKLIEEPPSHCIIILTAVSKEIFLETVISRVLCLRTASCTADECKAYFKSKKEYNTEDIEKAVAFGGGNIGKCVDFLCDPIFSQAMEIAERCMDAIESNDEYGLLLALYNTEGKKALFRQILIFMQEIMHKSCITSGGRLNEQECLKLYDIFSKSLLKLNANANQTLTANALAAEIFK